MIEPIFELAKPRECVTIFTPLGIRFWDPALDTQVSEGLTVTARPQGGHHSVSRAFRTASGIYAFQGLPGLHDVEYPTGGRVFTGSPPITSRFIVEVIDGQRRFLPAVFSVDLPYRGIFPTETVSSLLGSRPPGFYLFSAPTRPATPSLAAVRAQLVELVDATTQQPAAHAVLQVQVPGRKSWCGVADERGCVAVLFPYPTFTGTSGVTSPVTPRAGMVPQQWEVNLRVRYAPSVLTIPPGAKIPDLRSILSQTPGIIWSTLAVQPEQPVSQLSAQLTFGQELVVRTDHESVLLISPVASPP